jgi:hypothetical protein
LNRPAVRLIVDDPANLRRQAYVRDRAAITGNRTATRGQLALATLLVMATEPVFAGHDVRAAATNRAPVPERTTADTPVALPWPRDIRTRRLLHPARRTLDRLTPADRRALSLWAGAHLGLAVLAWMSS